MDRGVEPETALAGAEPRTQAAPPHSETGRQCVRWVEATRSNICVHSSETSHNTPGWGDRPPWSPSESQTRKNGQNVSGAFNAVVFCGPCVPGFKKNQSVNQSPCAVTIPTLNHWLLWPCSVGRPLTNRPTTEAAACASARAKRPRLSLPGTAASPPSR